MAHRAPILPAFLLAVLGVLASVRLAPAQCPEGTPPPCAPPAARAPAPPANSIAVLYFDNLSRDSADTYIADGLTDEVIVRLQHVPRLDVKSRYEVRRFRGTRIADARSVGRDLRVAYLVTGSVRPSPSRMRVTYELVRTRDGQTVASDIVDTTSADQWAISNGVALAIARQVAGRLAPEERAALARGPSRDAQAVDLYRRGMFFHDRGIRGDRDNTLWATGFFMAAVERDSTFVDAWAAIANAWMWMGDALFPNRLAAGNARAFAGRALALDSSSDLAAAGFAYAMMTVDYDWPGAERLLRRTIALDPRGVETRLLLSQDLAATGRLDEAWQQVEQAWAIDSLNPRVGYYLMLVLSCARRYDDLLRWSRRPTPWGQLMRFFSFLGTQRPDSALAVAGDRVGRSIALAAAGRLGDARDSVAWAATDRDSLLSRGLWLVAYDDWQAMTWAAVGDRVRAFAELERSYAQRSGDMLPWLKCWPLFDPLRDDPRYHDLLRRMNLEP